MYEGFNATKAERAAIDAGFRVIARFARSQYEADRWAKDEARGYGNRHDRIPLIAARGLVCQWFRDGAAKPDRLLRDFYWSRPVAVYVCGLGADKQARGEIDASDALFIARAVEAYDAAFKRMMDGDKAALADAMKAAR